MNAVATEPKKDLRPATEFNEVARNYVTPGVNIFETKDGYILEAEIPGVTKAGLDITLEGNELTIMARREPVAAGGELLYRESAHADYRRVFELDPAIDTSKIDAQVVQGLLTLRLPKSERVKPRKITVAD
jgi:HSP20 family protein